MSTTEQNVAETPWEDLRRGALEDYERASTVAHFWSSVIPQAINYYFDHAKPDSQQEAKGSTEPKELQLLREEFERSALGDRPQSISAAKLRRLIQLERCEAVIQRSTAAPVVGELGAGLSRKVIRVEQRAGRDCLRCCIAMVTGVDYADVPDFCADYGEAWPTACEKWLGELGMGLLILGGAPEYVPPWLPIIAQGKTDRSPLLHFVVVTASGIVDPSPYQSGLTEITDRYAVINSGALANGFIDHLARRHSAVCAELAELKNTRTPPTQAISDDDKQDSGKPEKNLAVPSGKPIKDIPLDAFADWLPLRSVRFSPGEYEIVNKGGNVLWMMEGSALAEWICDRVNESIPTTQSTATASALSKNVPDHSPASLAESVSAEREHLRELVVATRAITEQMREFSDAEHVLGCEPLIEAADEALAHFQGAE